VLATIERLLSKPSESAFTNADENEVANLDPNNFWRSSRTVRCDKPVHLHMARQRQTVKKQTKVYEEIQ
jgi:hypothetical protein